MAVNKIKACLRKILSCCNDEEDEKEWRPVIGEPFNFCHINARSPGLTNTEQEQLRGTLQPTIQDTTTTTNTNPSPNPRLDRVKAHTRALSNTLKTATSNPISTVGAKNAGYSSLCAGHSSLRQGHSPATLASGTNSPYEMTELLSHGGAETSKGSVETTWAGCEDDADSGRGFGRVG